MTLTSADNVTRENGSDGNYTINYEGYKARLISGQEIADIAGNQEWTPDGDNIKGLPTWLYSNMAVNEDMEIKDIYEHVVYWTDSAGSWYPSSAWSVYCDGYLGDNFVSYAYGYGVRPVVKILKSNL